MSYDFLEGENTPLTGNAKRLDDLVEDDVFRASVTVLGEIDYDTRSAAHQSSGRRFSADVTLGHLTRTLPGSGMHGMSGFG